MVKKFFAIFLAVLWGVSLGSCAVPQEPKIASAPALPTALTMPARTLPYVSEEDQIARGAFNELAVALFKAGYGEKNWVVSPEHTAVALELLLSGAGGQTREHLVSFLGFQDDVENDILWASLSKQRRQMASLSGEGIKQGWGFLLGEGPSVRLDFSENLLLGLDTKVELVDYYSENYTDLFTATVNASTGGLITRMSDVPTENCPLVLTASAAFDGKWMKGFNEENIRNTPFTLENGQRISTAVMMTKASPYVLTSRDCTFVSLPMEGQLEAWMILPSEDISLGDFISQLSADKLEAWRSQAAATPSYVGIPKVDITSSGDVSGILKAMQMDDLFDERADFSGIGSSVVLGRLIASARLRIQEAGIEAPDGAMSQRELRGLDQSMPTYLINRPYILVIAERQTKNLIMLAGIVSPG